MRACVYVVYRQREREKGKEQTDSRDSTREGLNSVCVGLLVSCNDRLTVNLESM